METLIAQSGGQSTTTTALIAGIAAVIGAMFTAVAARITANSKIKEIRETDQQRSRHTYLTDAREHLESVYVPLSIAINQLSRSYDSLRSSTDFEAGQSSPDHEESFKASTDAFIAGVNGLMKQGAGAFITTELELRLNSFMTFLGASLKASTPVQQTVLTLFSTRITTTSAAGEFLGSATRALRYMPVPFVGFPINPQAETQTIQAPITSRQFEKRFINDVGQINSLIKIVTPREPQGWIAFLGPESLPSVLLCRQRRPGK